MWIWMTLMKPCMRCSYKNRSSRKRTECFLGNLLISRHRRFGRLGFEALQLYKLYAPFQSQRVVSEKRMNFLSRTTCRFVFLCRFERCVCESFNVLHFEICFVFGTKRGEERNGKANVSFYHLCLFKKITTN